MFQKNETQRKKANRIIGHTVRTADGKTKMFKKLSRSLAIKMLCTECMGFGDPKECTSPLCPVFPFRKKTLASMRGDA